MDEPLMAQAKPAADYEAVGVVDPNDFAGEQPRVTVEYRSLRFKVNKRNGNEENEILKGLSGICQPGRLLSIMGPSGAGKTTLLDVMAGNVYGGTVQGDILVNGFPVQPRELKKMSCYVMQNPVLLSSATVRESLMTSTLLRLPMKIPRSQKVALVNSIMEDLGLTNCADVLIGNETEGIKGISGGEKRRLSVGVELVTQPSVVLLDEPTSGLDSEIALAIMTTLKKLASRGRTVVCTIHQPNSNIVETFDDFALISLGRTMYFGPWDGAVEFFSTAGYPCPVYKNPTDYFMSIAKDDEAVDVLAKGFAVVEEKQNANRISPDVAKGSEVLVALSKRESHVPGWFQTWVLWLRFMRTWRRHPLLMWAELSQYSFIGVFIGLMYFQSSNGLQKGVFDRYAAQYFILCACMFTPGFSAVTLWDNERVLVRVETARNAYQMGPYFLAKTLTTWPMETVFVTVYTILTYFMIGFQNDVWKFFVYWVTVLTFILISESIGLLGAVSTSKASFAILLLSLVFMPLMSFTGFIVRDIPVYFRWIKKIAYINFATSAMLVSEFTGAEFQAPNGDVITGDELLGHVPLEREDAELVRHTINDFDNGLPIWLNLVVLVSLLIGCRILTYLSLKISERFRLL